jgi:tetratricopeptide (TPR) repeat protein
MISLGFLAVLLLLLPLAIRVATKRRDAKRGLRWHGIQWEPPDEMAAAIERALSKQREGDLTGALVEYDRALALKRTSLALNNRGCALLAAGQVDHAIVDLREAVTIEPESATAHCSLAEALTRAGDHRAALESLKRAAALDPSWRVYARDAEAFAGLRETEEGRRWIAGE